MTNMTKKELAKVTRARYRLANKSAKTFMLNEFCGNTEYHRKYAIKLFNHPPRENRGRAGRRSKYDSRLFAEMIIPIWELLDYPCGTRLQPELVNMAEAMARSDEIELTEETKDQLKTISGKTLDRRLKREIAIRKLNRSRGTTRHGSLLKSSIPIRLTEWNRQELGLAEMDMVAHNGGDPSGEFINSLDLVEISSGWSEQYAVMGKGERGVVTAINEIKTNLPFTLTGLDSDSGGEFINWHLVRYCEKNNLSFTRSRPYMKNDNAYVEQKNNTHIRKLLGYERFDNWAQLELINDLYRKEWRLFSNFFRPVMKIERKEKVNNSLCRKVYDTAKTPYQRLMESGQISQEQKTKLRELYLSLNPVQLKNSINEKVKIICKSAERHSKIINVPAVAAKVTLLNV
ncbi:MAG: hypothetical protein ABIB72_01845 [Candidatus Falkowbacteria bacterium]